MQALRSAPSELIEEGFRLPGALRDRNGRVLAAAGTVLTATILQSLGSRRVAGLYIGEDWKAPASQAEEAPVKKNSAAAKDKSPTEKTAASSIIITEPETVSVKNLRCGMVLSRDIFDQSGVLLLARGQKITPRFLQLLGERQIRVVALKPCGDGSPSIGSDVSSKLERAQEGQGTLLDLDGRTPLVRRRLDSKEFWSAAKQTVVNHRRAAAALEGVCNSLISGNTMDATGMVQLINDFISTMTLDADLLPLIVGIQKSGDEYLFDHCVSTSLISMSIAAQLGLNQENIRCIGLGAMFHDIGMLRVPREIRMAPRPLTPAEIIEAHRHPYHTLEILEGITSFPREGSHIAYQVHERLNRCGYPKGRYGASIQPFAKIVAVADSFAAMIKKRPFRAAKQPHEAVKELLVSGKENQLDRTVLRALLDSVSAFPVGSLVELTKGVTGMVLRSNPGQHTRPVIVEVNGQGKPTERVIDLSQNNELQVVRALPGRVGESVQDPSDTP